MLLAAAVAPILVLAFDKPRPVEERLRTVLSTVQAVQFSYHEDALVVRFRTHYMKVPRPSKSRSMPPQELVSVEQPTPTGFKLEVYEFPHREGEGPRPTQAVRENPNWVHDYGAFKMDSGDRQLDGKDTARYYYLEWGNQFDKNLLSKIRRAIEQGTHPVGPNR